MNPRLLSVQLLTRLLGEGRSLSQLFEETNWSTLSTADASFTRALCFTVSRHYFRLKFLLDQLLHKPLRNKDLDVACVALCGLCQLIYMRVPDHAAVTESVKLADKLKKPWARGMLNALLRNYLRNKDTLQQAADRDEPANLEHPAWFITRVRQAWPQDWREILQANNQPPPMSLRVNLRKVSRDDYLQTLELAHIAARPLPHTQAGIGLHEPVDVDTLPGFSQGQVSVQDGAAQLAAALLEPAAGDRVLDACAAPGGKTAHLLEYQPKLSHLLALDRDATRLDRVRENLDRLGLDSPDVTLEAADAATTEAWWDGQLFDRILLDAPCSASGVIRRHPDIKLLRREDDIEPLADTQARLLGALWPLLKPGGMLLYATCSILPAENAEQVEHFINNNNDIELINEEQPWGRDTGFGRQILPGEELMDGFFYARLRKST